MCVSVHPQSLTVNSTPSPLSISTPLMEPQNWARRKCINPTAALNKRSMQGFAHDWQLQPCTCQL